MLWQEGAYGGYLEGIVDTWVMKFSTFNPEQGWLKSPFADPIKDMYPQYRDMMNKTDDPVALAFGKILQMCIMHRRDGHLRSDSLFEDDG